MRFPLSTKERDGQMSLPHFTFQVNVSQTRKIKRGGQGAQSLVCQPLKQRNVARTLKLDSFIITIQKERTFCLLLMGQIRVMGYAPFPQLIEICSLLGCEHVGLL